MNGPVYIPNWSILKLSAKLKHAEAIAERCEDAYSFDRYRRDGWRAAVRGLIRHGYNPAEIEAILRSKHTRWAADRASYPYGRCPGKVIVDWVMENIGHSGLTQLVQETFP